MCVNEEKSLLKVGENFGNCELFNRRPYFQAQKWLVYVFVVVAKYAETRTTYWKCDKNERGNNDTSKSVWKFQQKWSYHFFLRPSRIHRLFFWLFSICIINGFSRGIAMQSVFVWANYHEKISTLVRNNRHSIIAIYIYENAKATHLNWFHIELSSCMMCVTGAWPLNSL